MKDPAKSSRLISALGTSSLWGIIFGLATFGVLSLLFMAAPSAIALSVMPAIQLASAVVSIAGLVVGWKRATRQNRQIEALEQQAQYGSRVAVAQQMGIEPAQRRTDHAASVLQERRRVELAERAR